MTDTQPSPATTDAGIAVESDEHSPTLRAENDGAHTAPTSSEHA